MQKITIRITGMACGMCEAHICDAIRAAQPDAKKVRASRQRGEATLLSPAPNERRLRRAIEDAGYTVLFLSTEEYKKRGLFRRRTP